MSLLQNNTLYSQYPYLSIGSRQGVTDLNQVTTPSRLMGRFESMSPLCSIPIGYRKAWHSAIDDGGLGVTTEGINGSCTFVGSGVYGRGISVAIAGTGEITGSIAGIGHLLASLGGSGILEGSIAGAVFMAASLIGSGAVAASIKGVGVLSAGLGGVGGISNALINAVVSMTASLSGTGSVSNALLSGGKYIEAILSGEASLEADISAIGHMEATINIGFQPSALDIAQALLNAIAADYNTEGTIGNKINSAGTAGDPWSGLLANYEDDATFGAFIKKLLTTRDFIYMK